MRLSSTTVYSFLSLAFLSIISAKDSDDNTLRSLRGGGGDNNIARRRELNKQEPLVPLGPGPVVGPFPTPAPTTPPTSEPTPGPTSSTAEEVQCPCFNEPYSVPANACRSYYDTTTETFSNTEVAGTLVDHTPFIVTEYTCQYGTIFPLVQITHEESSKCFDLMFTYCSSWYIQSSPTTTTSSSSNNPKRDAPRELGLPPPVYGACDWVNTNTGQKQCMNHVTQVQCPGLPHGTYLGDNTKCPSTPTKETTEAIERNYRCLHVQ